MKGILQTGHGDIWQLIIFKIINELAMKELFSFMGTIMRNLVIFIILLQYFYSIN